MKINAIDVRNFNYPNFKGLTKTTEEVEDNTYYDNVYEASLGTYTNTKTIYYYPFADEKQTEISSFVAQNSYNRVSRNSTSDNQVVNYEKSYVEVQKPLSIRKEDYEQYLNSMNFAKKTYEYQQETARQAAIRALAPSNAINVEKVLISKGFDEYLAKI